MKSIVFVAILLMCVCFYPPSGFAARQVTVGIYPGSQAIWEYEAELNVDFDHILRFQRVKNLNYDDVVFYLDLGYDVILNIEFHDNFANLAEVAAGWYDNYLLELADQIKRDGRTIWLRPLHEFNGDWYNWGALYSGNSIEDFIAAWRHVVQLFRSQNAPVKFQLNYNRSNGRNDPTPFSAFWPGEDWVDMVVVTTYNRAYIDQWHPRVYWQTFAEGFDRAYQQVTALTDDPIGIAEMSSTSHEGNKSQWIIDAFTSILYDYPRVEQVTWFLINKKYSGEPLMRDWDLNTEQEKTAFTQGMNLLKAQTTAEKSLVVRGSDNSVYYRTLSGVNWSDWSTSPGSTADTPAAAVLGDHLHVVVQGVDGLSLWHSWINLADDSFSGWTLINGLTPSAPTLTCSEDTLYLIVRGLENQIWWRSYDYASEIWGDWQQLPSGAAYDSIATTVCDNKLHMVVQALDGLSLWHSWIDLSDDSFSGWMAISGLTPSAPTLVSSDDTLYLIVRGQESQIWYRSYDCSSSLWSDWDFLPSGAAHDSIAVSVTGTKLDMVVQALDGLSLWYSWIDLSDDSFSGWMAMSGLTPSAPTLAE